MNKFNVIEKKETSQFSKKTHKNDIMLK